MYIKHRGFIRMRFMISMDIDKAWDGCVGALNGWMEEKN